jgi:Flp pilus assembly protein TadG
MARRITSAVTRRVAALRSDRGDIVGWAIMIPLSIALFLTAVQAAMWYQARNLCQAAAQAGTRAGAAYNAASGAGSQAAADYLAATGDNSVHATRVGEHRTTQTITVTCSADPLTLLPLPGLTTAHQSSTAARERFTTPSGQFRNSEVSGGGN